MWAAHLFTITALKDVIALFTITSFFFWNRCDCYDLYDQCIPYMNAWEWQQAKVKKSITAIQEGHDVNAAVIILQHSSVYTMGTRSSEEYLLFDKRTTSM